MAHKDFFRIKVIKCNNQTSWYLNEIGNEFNVQEWLGLFIAIDLISGKKEPCFIREDITFLKT